LLIPRNSSPTAQGVAADRRGLRDRGHPRDHRLRLRPTPVLQRPHRRRADGLTRADLARCHPRGRGEKVGVMGRCHRRTASAGAALLIAAGAGGAAAAEQSLSLVISGDEGARYTGRCTLTTAAGESGPSKSGPRRSPPAGTLPGAPRPSLPHHPDRAVGRGALTFAGPRAEQIGRPRYIFQTPGVP
jgi:hypothetical protein